MPPFDVAFVPVLVSVLSGISGAILWLLKRKSDRENSDSAARTAERNDLSAYRTELRQDITRRIEQVREREEELEQTRDELHQAHRAEAYWQQRASTIEGELTACRENRKRLEARLTAMQAELDAAKQAGG